MLTKTMTLAPEDFFHARPASRIAAAAKPFQSMVMVCLGTELADAKNAFALMRLSHPRGGPFDLLADGPDESEALETVTRAVQEAFSEADGF